MATNYAFPMEGMMGPSVPIFSELKKGPDGKVVGVPQITAQSSMFAPGATTTGSQAPGGTQNASTRERDELAQKLKSKAQGAQAFLGKYAAPALGIASAIPGVATSLSEINEGRPAGALAALAPTALSAVGAGLLGKGGVAGTAVGLGLMGLGAILPGAAASGAESVRQDVTGKPTKGKEGEFSTQMAINKQLAELGTTQYRDNMGVYTSALRDLSKAYSDQEYLNLQRNIPLINQLKNAELVRSQALINTQNQAYLQQGVVSTAGALATGAQQQTGATVRQALATNPYNIALQSPAINFG